MGVDARSTLPGKGLPRRAAGRFFGLAAGLPRRDPGTAWSEASFLASSLGDEECLFHFLGEGHVGLHRSFLFDPRRCIDTFHQPYSLWRESALALLSPLRRVILLWRRDMERFRAHLPSATIDFVHHGVDTGFFTPGVPADPPRLLYNGVHLRNLAMLERVVSRVFRNHPDVSLDALVPLHSRRGAVFERLMADPRITWHAGLGDEALRALYRRAYLLLLPLEESGANTAVVEALSCGLPVVTTDVGGIRDYGGGEIYPLVGNNRDDAMLEILDHYLKDRVLRDRVGGACRRFALEHLDWGVVAGKHLAIYREMPV
jgi:glycosyltransferase involved in cell wall biosynthesis